MIRRLAVPLLLLASLLAFPASSGASASATPPPHLERWPTCSARPQYCVQSLRVDGVDELGGGTWKVDAYLLDDTSANWYVMGTGSIDPPPASSRVELTVNLGGIRPLFTQATAADLFLTPGGDATDGYTIAVEASSATLEWKFSTADGHNCSAGDCGDATTAADTESRILGGNTQNMDTWTPDDRARFAGMWFATDAQYASLPLFGSFPTPRWFLQLGNPHLALDGVTPVVGTYSAYVPQALLDEVGATAADAAATGLDVTRSDGGTVTTVGASVMDVGDGGVYLRIPQVHFSTPTFKFKGTGGRKLVLQADEPGGVGGTPLDGAAVIRFRQPPFDGGSAITGYDVTCRAAGTTVSRSSPAAVAVEVRGLQDGETWSCRVRGNNASRLGKLSYSVHVTPQEGLSPIAPGATPAISRTVSPGGALDVSWALPRSSGGSPVTGYRVDVCRAGHPCPAGSVLTRNPGDRSIHVAAGALANGRYTVLIRARNAVGLGDPARRSVSIG
jgi:hypothetical protein